MNRKTLKESVWDLFNLQCFITALADLSKIEKIEKNEEGDQCPTANMQMLQLMSGYIYKHFFSQQSRGQGLCCA